MRKFRSLLVLHGLLIGLTAGSSLQAGSVSGVVRDWGVAPPKNGVPLADVEIQKLDGTPVAGPVKTMNSGEYTIPNIPDGDYKVVVNATGYLPRPHDLTTVSVNGDAKVDPDITVTKAVASAEYFGQVAAAIVLKAQTMGDKKGAYYRQEWETLRKMNLPPSAKVQIAQGLGKKEESINAYVPEVKEYRTMQTENVLKAEKYFGDVFAGEKEFPGQGVKGELKVTDVVIADIVLFNLRSHSEKPEHREAMKKLFLEMWKDTPAVDKYFKDFQDKKLDMIPSVLPAKRK